jgi:hypothetical protein
VAEALRDWLPFVINAVEPWMSEEDIDKGARWSPALAAELEKSQVGIICLTAENLESLWLHFEAGALSKSIENSRVCPYLFGLEPLDVKGPLAQFQAATQHAPDTRRLLHTINGALENNRLPEGRVNEAFDVWWPKLDERLAHIPPPVRGDRTPRRDRELLEEILETVRGLARNQPIDIGDPRYPWPVLARHPAKVQIFTLAMQHAKRMGLDLSQSELVDASERVAHLVAPDLRGERLQAVAEAAVRQVCSHLTEERRRRAGLEARTAGQSAAGTGESSRGEE